MTWPHKMRRNGQNKQIKKREKWKTQQNIR